MRDTSSATVDHNVQPANEAAQGRSYARSGRSSPARETLCNLREVFARHPGQILTFESASGQLSIVGAVVGVAPLHGGKEHSALFSGRAFDVCAAGKVGSFCSLANRRDTWPEVRPTLPGVRTKWPAMHDGCVRKPVASLSSERSISSTTA
mmetsp:Transcript_49325/g.107413  ORF Transcript_49325/g.107413 Transcript_49325/m.107413 type:complete len:151 (+) Transcript_49325:286-738(+)